MNRIFLTECKLYVDDSKIIRVIEDESSAESLQRDIDSVTKWTREWLMKLNSSKCKVKHFGYRNVGSNYFIDDLSTEQRIDLEVSESDLSFRTTELKWSKHVSNIGSKGNKGLIIRFKYFTISILDK